MQDQRHAVAGQSLCHLIPRLRDLTQKLVSLHTFRVKMQNPLKGLPGSRQLSILPLGSAEDHVGADIVRTMAEPLLTNLDGLLVPSLLAVRIRELGEDQSMGISCQPGLVSLNLLG